MTYTIALSTIVLGAISPTLQVIAEAPKVAETQAVTTEASPENVEVQASSSDIASGVFGTAPWRIDSSGVLHIGTGQFSNTTDKVSSPWNDHQKQINEIVFEGKVTGATDSYGLFSNLSNVKSISNLSSFDTSNVTDMSGMFDSMSSLTSLDLSSFDTSNVTNMNAMFSRMSSLTNLDLSSFDTSNVTNMNSMFYIMSSLTSLDLSSFDTSNVTDMSGMFYGAPLHSLTLGSKTRLIPLFLGLNNPIADSNYTGKWQTLGTGTKDLPNGNWVGDSSELINRSTTNTPDTYVWQPIKRPAQDVTVEYVDENGRKLPSVSSQTISGNIGDPYDATTNAYKLKIPGYTLDESKLPANGKGTLSDQAQTVTYVYTKAPVAGGDVTVHYQDESGKSISDDVILKGNVGESYSSSKKDIKNYTFKEIKGAASGKFTDKAQTVTYVYKENSTPPSKQEVVNVYRLYNKKSMEHLYTADAYEYKHLPELSSDWVREGINFKEYKKSDSTTVTVHRVYNPKSGEHLNTTDS
ncbi:MucBP domain-containing protein, partial [Lactococcus garvieae]